MSNGFNPLSMFKPTGNPVVQKLLQNRQTPLNQLLDQQSFPSEFRRDNHELLEKYMTYKKYKTLVDYITQVGDEKDKNRSYKYPFIAAEILSIQNQHTFKYFVTNKNIIEQQVIIEQVEIQQQVDSDRSFVSSRSEGSIVSDESQAQKQSFGDKNSLDQVEGQKQKQNEQKSLQNMPQISSLQKNASQINQDDFPFIQQVKKTKKVKQKRQRIINHEYKPLLNNLFDYFESKQLNHILTGYVCKVINALLCKNASIYPQLLHRAQTTLFLTHLQSRSTQDLLIRILTYQNEDQNDITFQYNLLMICLHKVYDDRESLVVQNLSFMICEVINKISQGQITSKHYRKLIKQIVRLSFFGKLCDFFQQTVKVLEEYRSDNDKEQIEITELRIKQLAKITTNFLDLLLKIKDKQVFKQDYQIVSHEYEDHINKFTESAYKKLQFQALEEQQQTKNNPKNSKDKKSNNSIKPEISIRNKYGMSKILLINLLFTLIKENLGFTQQILAEKQCFFEILLQIVKKSSLNSILHNSVFSIFEFFIQNLKKDKLNSQIFIVGSMFKQLFDYKSKYALLEFSYQTFKQNEKIQKSTQKKGYTGHLIKLCTSIHNLTESQIKDYQFISAFKSKPQWNYIVQTQIQPQLLRIKTNLGNYTKRRDVKAHIQFDKDVILDHFKEFLKGTKFSTLDEFDNFEEDNHSDAEETEEQRNHHAGHAKIDKNTEKQIQQMEMEEFQINSGMGFKAGDETNTSINTTGSE